MQDSIIGKKFAQELPDLAGLNRHTDASSDKHADWLAAEGVRSFMAGHRVTLYINLVTIPLLFATMYGLVNMTGLWLWVSAATLLLGYRFWLTECFENQSPNWEVADFLKFLHRYAWTWPAASATWGALTFLFYAKSPILIQFIVWTSLVCVSVFGVTSYVGHLKTLKNFINALVVVCLIAMFWTSFRTTDPTVMNMTLKLTPLILVFWMMLITQGKRLNDAFRQRMVLLKGNMELIDSLRAQTERAVTAIDMKNRLLASAAHDIRQPVLALDVYASMLRAEPEMAGVLTEKIELATKSVIEMFDSLFDLSRLDAGQLKISNSDIDVLALMRELELQYKPAALNKRLELRMRSGSFKIYTDQQLLKRILGNLLMNAIKFTNKGGVLLACRPTAKGIRFEVWDTGVGIAPDEQAAVFGEFYKSNTHLGTSEGFGLGLSIVSRLCEPLGFNFSMKSRLGRGSVFVLEVPTVTHRPLKA